MSISDKIKAIMAMKHLKVSDLAQYLGINSQSVSNKLYRDSFTAADLVKISTCLGCELAFIIDDNHKIILDMDDIKQDE